MSCAFQLENFFHVPAPGGLRSSKKRRRPPIFGEDFVDDLIDIVLGSGCFLGFACLVIFYFWPY